MNDKQNPARDTIKEEEEITINYYSGNNDSDDSTPATDDAVDFCLEGKNNDDDIKFDFYEMKIESYKILKEADINHRIEQVNLQLTNDVLMHKFVDPKCGEFSIRNVLPRLVFRSLSIAIATTLAAMFPFFGNINAVIGAFGCIPLDIILPMVFYNATFKPSKQGLMFWVNTLIATIFSALGVLGAISSIRQIVLDANTYSLFANLQ